MPPGAYLYPAPWPVKLTEREEKLNEIYVLRKQCDNLCCAVEMGCYHIIIKLSCSDQMWNLDKELYRALWLSLWLASPRRAAGSSECLHILKSLSGSERGLIWSLHPVISPLLTQVSHKEHSCAVESPGCLETQMVWFCPSHHCQALFLRVFFGKEGFLNIIFLSFYF